MYEVVFSSKKAIDGQIVNVNITEVKTNPFVAGTTLDDGRIVVSSRKLPAATKSKVKTETKRLKSVAFLKPVFEKAWGRSKWGPICDMHVENLFEKLEYDMVLERAGINHPKANSRWLDFKEAIKNATLDNPTINKKLETLESQFLIKNFFLSR